jgi:hypothetical protein
MATLKKRKISIILDDPDEIENFFRGLIIARQNNSSPYFTELIDGVNAVMEPYRMEVIAEQQEARSNRSGQRVTLE